MKHVQVCFLLFMVFSPLYLCAQLKDSTKTDESLNVLPKPSTKYRGYQVIGKVIDKTDRLPVPYATVFFAGTNIGTSTDADGVFILQFQSFPADSLNVKVIGYDVYSTLLDKSEKINNIIIELERISASLNEVVIKPGEDPAIILMRNVINNKKNNNPERVDNYKYEAYNKIEVDLLNFKRKTFDKLPIPYLKKLGFIFDNMDTTSYDKPFLPAYLTESLSDYYYQKSPKKTKEFVKATQMKAIKNENMTRSISQYLGKIYLEIDPYENYVPFFDKEFVSPLSNTALTFYKYKILDTQSIYGYDVITLSFKPQRKGEQCFEGTIRIVDSIYALQYLSAALPDATDINWVEKADFYKEYTPFGDTIWFCSKENITAELALSDEIMKTLGLIVRKTTSYDSVVVNDPSISDIVNSKKFKSEVIVADSATVQDADFWKNARHEELSKNEQGVYQMYDSLDNDRNYKRLRKLIKIVASGVVKAGPVEFGPYWDAYNYNQIEGNRFQFSMGTTPKLFEDIYMNGYIAYGAGDNRFKYKFESFFLLHRYPRRYINFAYKRDVDYTVNYYDKVGINNIISVGIRKNGIPPKFMFSDDIRFELFNESASGFSQLFTVYRKIYDPYDPLPSVSIFENGFEGAPSQTVTATEVSLKLRFAYKERFLHGNYLRFSLGSKYPIVDLRLALGIKGLFDADYNYQRITMTIADNWRMPPFGQLYVNVFAGKYFGVLPYPLLEQHPGNEFYYYNKYTFNMMNQYEFLSDEFVGINLEHNFGGGIFKYVPLIKKLRWRQFWTAKSVIGNLSQANRAYNFDKGFTFRSLDGSPYLELGTGIENIFKLLRVDFVWRVTPTALPDENVKRDFGIFGSVKLGF